MKLSHTLPATSAVFDDPNLVSAAGLVPVLALADRAGLRRLADEHLSVPGDKGANAGLKVASLVAGMVAGADSIDDMALLRHGGMGRVFARAYAPSTLGSFLRSFTFGHVRQLDALASRFLTRLAAQGERAAQVVGDGTGGRVLVDIDDTIIQVHGHAKQGAGFGYSGVRGLNALLATVTTSGSAPVVVAQRLRKGSCGSPRGAKRLVAETLKTVSTLHGRSDVKPLLRADSAFYGAPTVGSQRRQDRRVHGRHTRTPPRRARGRPRRDRHRRLRTEARPRPHLRVAHTPADTALDGRGPHLLPPSEGGDLPRSRNVRSACHGAVPREPGSLRRHPTIGIPVKQAAPRRSPQWAQ